MGSSFLVFCLDEFPLNLDDALRERSQPLEYSLAQIKRATRAELRGASVGDASCDGSASRGDLDGPTALGGTLHLVSVHGHDHVVGVKGGTAGANRVGEPCATTAESGRGVLSCDDDILLLSLGHQWGSGVANLNGGGSNFDLDGIDRGSRDQGSESSSGNDSELVEDGHVERWKWLVRDEWEGERVSWWLCECVFRF